jgi:choline dehydrogenase-like flavoprotein
MDHPRLRIGRVYLKDPNTFRRVYDMSYLHWMGGKRRSHGQMTGAKIALSETVQEREGLLQCLTSLDAAYLGDGHPAVDYAKAIYRAMMRKDPRQPVPPGALMKTLAGLPAVTTAYMSRALKIQKLVRSFTIEALLEPVPDPNNRVTLLHERDQLGMNRVHLSWRIGDLERQTHKRLVQLIKAQVEERGIGHVRFDEAAWDNRWENSVLHTWHHMGTTRMHQNARLGVVDENCRIHGLKNLYIGGSSVFPTGSGRAPTLTIVALALRLAEHLAATARQSPSLVG